MKKKLTNKEKAQRYDLTVTHTAEELNRCKMRYNQFKNRELGGTEEHRIKMIEYYMDTVSALRPIYFLYLLDLPAYETSVMDFLNDDTYYLPT